MLDKAKSMQTFIDFLNVLREDPTEAHSLRLVLSSGEAITVRVEIENVIDRLILLTSGMPKKPRLSLLPSLPEPHPSSQWHSQELREHNPSFHLWD